MNKINQLFRQKDRNILSVYFTAGFPQLNDTGKVIKALQDNGVDMAEVGIPFSDPMADGVVIQKSSTIALRNGMNLKLLFSQLATIVDETRIPLVMMGYLNPIMQYGFEKFCHDCRQAGVSGVIIPDLPFEDYLQYYKSIADSHDLRMIMLIAPETPEDRVRLIDAKTDGFIYMVSSAGTTGAQKSFDEGKRAYFRKINGMGLRNPRLIGFGISNRDTLDAAFENAAGAIIGSKFVSLLMDKKSPEEAVVSLKYELFEK
ncbi:MAG: tryptophan synthase subunit alpha [Dysgonamonadaceae bacterium]|jgi:tryptophan synthase alpha chain|nr:tryptophan synthase subunit alpha [Dysgonamonadaceae bacterium]